MSSDKYLFFDGTNYISPCDCNISIYNAAINPQIINPNNCIIKFYDGANWCNLNCPCECPRGYTFNYVTNDCVKQESAVFTGTTTVIAQGDQNALYTGKGLRLYEDLSAYTLPLAGDAVASPATALIDNNGAGATITPAIASLENRLWGVSSGTCAQSSTQGRLNVAGIWPTGYPKGTNISFEYCIDLVAPKQFLFGMSGDDMILSINSGSGFVDQVKLKNATPTTNYDHQWWVFPITLPTGNHIIKFTGQDNQGTTGAIAFEIYDMGALIYGANAPYATPYAKFLDVLTTAAGTSPNCGNVETDLAPFIKYSSKNLIGYNVAASGSSGTWSCPDGSAVDYCNGTPQCIDAKPCEGNVSTPISSATEINIWYDNSGSMDTTEGPLRAMLSGFDDQGDPVADNLKDCLLPIYQNDSALYDERVKFFPMSSTQIPGTSNPTETFHERFIKCLGVGLNFGRTADNTVTQVINLTFADESNDYGYGNQNVAFDSNSAPSNRYREDVNSTILAQTSASFDLRGVAFRVITLNDQGAPKYPAFRGLTQATFINVGPHYDGTIVPPGNLSQFYGTKYNCNLDTEAGDSAENYRDIIRNALNALGLNIPVCP